MIDQATSPPSTNLQQNQSQNQPEPKKSKKLLIISIFLVLFSLSLFLVKLYFSQKNKFNNNSQTLSSQLPNLFADFKLEKSIFTPSIQPYTIGLSSLYNLSSFEKENNQPFSQIQKDTLTKDNFFIINNLDKFYQEEADTNTHRYDDWTDLYSDIGGGSIDTRAPENSVFITSDFLLHVYHKLLEKEFEHIEQKEFYPKLLQITDKLLEASISQQNTASDQQNKQSFSRIAAFFAIPKVILDSAYQEFSSENLADTQSDTEHAILTNLDQLEKILPKEAYQLAKQELELILKAEAIQLSPLFGDLLNEADLFILTDYTQFNPRSHYNKNSVLRSYFKAMMWYGRTNFVLKSNPLTQDAINISLLVNQTGVFSDWEDISLPISFFVGQSDDLGLQQYLSSINQSDNNKLKVDDELINQVKTKLETYPGPQIMSSAIYGDKVFDLTKEELQAKTKGFRFMGQRFTPDAFIFTTLTQGDEKSDPETGESLPSMTTPLMVMSVFGNSTADQLTNQWIQNSAPNSKNVLNNRLNYLKKYFNDKNETEWTQNIYWSWLYTIKSLFKDYPSLTGYPMFMKNNAWANKTLQTSLGSWTELKHDTLLYAKQSYAEKGAGGEVPEIPPVPKGYIEPNIEFFDRLITLTQMSMEGLNSRGLLNNEFIGRNEKFIEALKFFRTFAINQLENQNISDDDFETLRTKAGRLGYQILGPLPGEQYIEDHVRSALIADIHTDFPGGEILYVANGIPNYIYVAVNDINGIRLTKGLVFSYYEFTQPIGKRLTDQDWRSLNYTQDKSQLPALPDWNSTLIK
ncbi:MAG: DUF3160 domain-containing protein [Candidatus Beckwithbacteria bacterium]|nr:DUF3160 domain-containing protein [Patescibacteria group bacterium]